MALRGGKSIMGDNPLPDVPRERLPRHIAIIMDGNGRWARKHGLPRIEGHRHGAESVRRAVEVCADAKIRYLTLYAFSTENWKRPRNEVQELMRLLEDFLKRHIQDFQKHKVRLNTIGEIERLPARVRGMLDRVQRATAENAEGVLTLALSYGARAEITAAVREIAREVRAGALAPDAITEETVAAHLYTADLPDPDLIIRTSGELRLSNFLLWQCAYSELIFIDAYWPDFSAELFEKALIEYASRDRRFGGVRTGATG